MPDWHCQSSSAILGMMGSQSLLHVGALSERLSEGFLVLIAVCSVRSSCVLYLVVVSMVVLSQTISVNHACKQVEGYGRIMTETCFMLKFYWQNTSNGVQFAEGNFFKHFAKGLEAIWQQRSFSNTVLRLI